MSEDQPYSVEDTRRRYAEKEARARGIGIIAGLIAFACSWIYCMSQYGFLWGFGFGWAPSLILAAIVGFSAFGLAK